MILNFAVSRQYTSEGHPWKMHSERHVRLSNQRFRDTVISKRLQCISIMCAMMLIYHREHRLRRYHRCIVYYLLVETEQMPIQGKLAELQPSQEISDLCRQAFALDEHTALTAKTRCGFPMSAKAEKMRPKRLAAVRSAFPMTRSSFAISQGLTGTQPSQHLNQTNCTQGIRPLTSHLIVRGIGIVAHLQYRAFRSRCGASRQRQYSCYEVHLPTLIRERCRKRQ